MASPDVPTEPMGHQPPSLNFVFEPDAANRLRLEEQARAYLSLAELHAQYDGIRWPWLTGQKPRETK